jgi:hypothetical protein
MAPIDNTDPRAEAVRLMAAALREHFGDCAHDLARRMFDEHADETWRLILEELTG